MFKFKNMGYIIFLYLEIIIDYSLNCNIKKVFSKIESYILLRRVTRFMILRLKNVLKNLNRIEEFFISVTLLFVTLLLFINVFTRYCFGYSLKWAEELTRYLLIWVTFVGSSVCVSKQKHVGIDVLLTKCPIGMRWIIKLVIAIIGLLFSIVLTVYGWKITSSVILSKQLSPAMMLPMYLVYISIPIGGFLMVIKYFQIILAYLRNVMQKEKENSVNSIDY